MKQSALFHEPRPEVVIRWRCGWLTMRASGAATLITRDWLAVVACLQKEAPEKVIRVR